MHNSIAADQLLRELAISVARNNVGAMRPVAEIAAAEGLTQTEYDAIAVNPAFQRYVDAFTKEFRDNGYSLQAKARILVEDLMASLYHDVKDKDQPLAARAKVFDTMVSIADAIPKNNQNVVAGPGFSITFNLSGGSQTITKSTSEVLYLKRRRNHIRTIASTKELYLRQAGASCHWFIFTNWMSSRSASPCT